MVTATNTQILMLILLVATMPSLPVRGQVGLPAILSENGDTIDFVYPVPDSVYKPNEVIVTFRPSAISLSLLCYQYSWYSQDRKEGSTVQSMPSNVRSDLMNQRFSVDALVLSPTLREFFSSNGLYQFRRVTVANPCADTISIARNGDTLSSSDFLIMVGEISNDTSVTAICVGGTFSFQNEVVLIEPNYRAKFNRNPNDQRYVNQKSYAAGLFNAARAWDFQTGNYGVKVGVVDVGIDFHNCDLGGNIGLGYKVVGGWNWGEDNANVDYQSGHGTAVAGIIGALTNRNCVDTPFGIAGIGGGWGPQNQMPDEGIGVQMFAFKVNEDNDEELFVENAIAAIREGSENNPETAYGYGVHVLNNSWSVEWYSESLRSAVNFAYEHQVNVVCSSGNYYDNQGENRWYPAAYDGKWVTKVGASDIDGNRAVYSIYGNDLDCIAPGGYSNKSDGRIVYTTYLNGGHAWFDGTSAAAPHVSGLIALIRSESIDKGWGLVEPEDFEGIVKAAAKSKAYGEYLKDYNKNTGWGNTDAGRVFEMFDGGFRVFHFSSDYQDLEFGAWSGYFQAGFSSDGRFNKPLATGFGYRVKRRMVTAEIVIPIDNFVQTEDRPVFVWGRSGASDLGGWSAANPNYQTAYTEINDDVFGSNEPGISGLYLADGKSSVECKTFQYDVYNNIGQHIGKYPADEDIKLFLSVYAIMKPSDVQVISGTQQQVSLRPNPSRGYVRFSCFIEGASSFDVEVSNALGELVAQRSSVSPDEGADLLIATGTWAAGVYFMKIISRGFVKTRSFVVEP